MVAGQIDRVAVEVAHCNILAVADTVDRVAVCRSVHLGQMVDCFACLFLH